MPNIVAIIGRPNVGKSTLFNRLTESRKAIVDEASGVTRDRHYGKVEWNGIVFTLIDTGGYATGSGDVFEKEIRKQVTIAVEEADRIIFLTDVTTGITDLDSQVAGLLRKSGKKIFVVVNKVDNNQRAPEASVFHKLGLGEIFCISAASGAGTGDLLDSLVGSFDKKQSGEETALPKFAIVGQPNVGKSSLLNALIGRERTIVTPVAGTTRDTIHTRYTAYGHDFMLIDTAGLRKKSNVHEDIEFYSVMRTVRAIEESDVCLLLVDAAAGITAQDQNILHLAEVNKKGVVLLVNKWDLVKKSTNSARDYEAAIREKIAPFNDIPVIFISVLEKQRLLQALEAAVKVFENRRRKIPGASLNKVMLPIIESYPPPAVKGKFVKIKYISQLPAPTPVFAFFCNSPQYINENYRRFLENKMRENFGFSGVPLVMVFRNKRG